MASKKAHRLSNSKKLIHMSLGIPFIHKTSSRSRSVKIHMDTDGTVIVTTPNNFPKVRIPTYIENARAWIEAQRAKIKDKPALWTESSLFYFGQKHEIQVSQKMDGTVLAQDGKILVAPFVLDAQSTYSVLEKWLKHRVAEYCLPRLQQIASEMGTTYK